MATVAEIAAQQARELLEELDLADELAYRRQKKELEEDIGVGITTYVLLRFSEPKVGTGWIERQRQVTALLEYTNYHDAHPKETIQRFLNQHIPNWPVLATRYIDQHCYLWRKRLLEPDEEEA